MDFVKIINSYLNKIKENERLDTLMDLAFEAGIETFNPYRAKDYELKEIALLISGR